MKHFEKITSGSAGISIVSVFVFVVLFCFYFDLNNFFSALGLEINGTRIFLTGISISCFLICISTLSYLNIRLIYFSFALFTLLLFYYSYPFDFVVSNEDRIYESYCFVGLCTAFLTIVLFAKPRDLENLLLYVTLLSLVLFLEFSTFLGLTLIDSPLTNLFKNTANRYSGYFTGFTGTVFMVASLFLSFALTRPMNLYKKITICFFVVLLVAYTQQRSYMLSVLLIFAIYTLKFLPLRLGTIVITLGAFPLSMMLFLFLKIWRTDYLRCLTCDVVEPGATDQSTVTLVDFVASLISRLAIYIRSFGTIYDNFPLGVGPGISGYYRPEENSGLPLLEWLADRLHQIDPLFSRILEDRWNIYAKKQYLGEFQRSHNTILDFFVDFGIFGFFIGAMFFLKLFQFLAFDFKAKLSSNSGHNVFVHFYAALGLFFCSLLPVLLTKSLDIRLLIMTVVFGFFVYCERNVRNSII